ncbi:hypothetical protein VNI00_012842 [Paramarasmius palmivorus]|uniref:Uncharacterized protein n=1 Tax=Paramarasmius palmivorus TaxID=297713 RepID=A0AAW0C4Y3_9AGAR
MNTQVQTQFKLSLPAPSFQQPVPQASGSSQSDRIVNSAATQAPQEGVTISPKLITSVPRASSPLQFMCQDMVNSSDKKDQQQQKKQVLPGSHAERSTALRKHANTPADASILAPSIHFGGLFTETPSACGSADVAPSLVAEGQGRGNKKRAPKVGQANELRRTSERLRKLNERSQNSDESQEYFEDFSSVSDYNQSKASEASTSKPKVPLITLQALPTENIVTQSANTEKPVEHGPSTRLESGFEPTSPDPDSNTSSKRRHESPRSETEHPRQRRKLDIEAETEGLSTKTDEQKSNSENSNQSCVLQVPSSSQSAPITTESKDPGTANHTDEDKPSQATGAESSIRSEEDPDTKPRTSKQNLDSKSIPSIELHPTAKQIFKERLQHRVLRPFYLDFATQHWISQMRFGKLVPYITKRDMMAREVYTARYGLVMQDLDVLERTSLVRIMSFVSHSNYINITRAPPLNIRTGNNLDACLIDQGPNADRPAIFVAPAMVTSSELVRGSGEFNKKSRKIHIQLLSQDYEYASSFICTLMEDETVHCPIYAGSLCLQSKKQGSTGSPSKNQAPDQKDLQRFRKTKSKKNVVDSPLPDAPFRLYHHNIPIYDGRPDGTSANDGFRADPTAWDNMSSMPRLRGEIPACSLVIPGFTLSGPWSVPSNPNHPTVHFNLMFVILLSTPTANAKQKYEDPDDSGIETDNSHHEYNENDMVVEDD